MDGENKICKIFVKRGIYGIYVKDLKCTVGAKMMPNIALMLSYQNDQPLMYLDTLNNTRVQI